MKGNINTYLIPRKRMKVPKLILNSILLKKFEKYLLKILQHYNTSLEQICWHCIKRYHTHHHSHNKYWLDMLHGVIYKWHDIPVFIFDTLCVFISKNITKNKIYKYYTFILTKSYTIYTQHCTVILNIWIK